MTQDLLTDRSGRGVLLQTTVDHGMPALAPRYAWDTLRETEHVAQFYETDAFLLQTLRDFVATGLRTGEGVIVVATSAHREGLDLLLEESGLDLAAARAAGQFVALDAAGTLATFMQDGDPDPARFTAVIGTVVSAAARGRPGLRAFGEMVALLWAEGNHAAALHLEDLWNGLQRQHAFRLFCAYRLHGFDADDLTQSLSNVCAAHSHALPSESYSGLNIAEDRLRAIVRLQHQARLLQVEVAAHTRTEAALRVVKGELEVQLEDLRRLHEMSARLSGTLELETVLHEVLDAALAMQGTSMGLLSLCDGRQQGLTLQASRGFDATLLHLVAVQAPGVGVCGTSYRDRRRVIVEDTEADLLFAPYREVAQAGGFRACHGTPLLTRSGTLVGVLTAHFPEPHRCSQRELRLMDLYAQIAADVIESAQLHQQLHQELQARNEALAREQTARADAEQAGRLKDEFLATVSHELRTPLTAIIGWAQRLKSGRLSGARASHAAEVIERSAQAQARLVEDLLDVSRVVTGKLQLTVEPVDLAAVIGAAIDSLQVAADAKGIQIEMIVDRAACQITADGSRLQQVMWNLLVNAIKFTPAGGQVGVRVDRVDPGVQITVSDTGEGISAEVLPFIFERFRQANSTSTRRHGGLGLGLAIVRHLVEVHGGMVQAASAGEHCGSTFTISLPRGSVQNQAPSLISDPASVVTTLTA